MQTGYTNQSATLRSKPRIGPTFIDELEPYYPLIVHGEKDGWLEVTALAKGPRTKEQRGYIYKELVNLDKPKPQDDLHGCAHRSGWPSLPLAALACSSSRLHSHSTRRNSMNATLAMLLRYALSAFIMFGVGRGWWTEAAGGMLSDFIINLIAFIVAGLPPLYAALFVDNTPVAKFK